MGLGGARGRFIGALAALPALALAAPAGAQPTVTLPPNLSAVIDLRLVGADGEPSWTDRGFGKARFGSDGEFDTDALPAEGTLVWRPPLSWDIGGTIAVAAQHGQDQPVDLVEAFLSWRPVPRSATRFSARAGLFWPPVSLEHEGAAWSVSGMITPSAINSWIGEEVKIVGLEATASRPLAGGQASATIGLFGFNDTAGTLLSFRGWALHDQKSAAFSRQPLPPQNAFVETIQPPWTTPTVEIDDRPGFYAKLGWHMAPVTLEAFYYHNRGNPEQKTLEQQWGWDTRFLNVGARVDLGPHTRLLVQALTGATEMGFPSPTGRWVDTRFRSAYLRLTHDIGRATVSGRVDLFDTSETGSRMAPQEESEEGWALTGAVDLRLTDQAEAILEVLHIDSDRGARLRTGFAPRQEQTLVQAALRLSL